MYVCVLLRSGLCMYGYVSVCASEVWFVYVYVSVCASEVWFVCVYQETLEGFTLTLDIKFEMPQHILFSVVARLNSLFQLEQG